MSVFYWILAITGGAALLLILMALFPIFASFVAEFLEAVIDEWADD